MHLVCKSLGIFLINKLGWDTIAKLVISAGCDFTKYPLHVSNECICNCKWLDVLLSQTRELTYDGHEKLEYMLKIISKHPHLNKLIYAGTFHEHELDVIAHTRLSNLTIKSNVYNLSDIARIFALLPRTNLLQFSVIIPLHLRTRTVIESISKLDPICIWNYYDPRSESNAYNYIEEYYHKRVTRYTILVRHLQIPVELIRELSKLLD